MDNRINSATGMIVSAAASPPSVAGNLIPNAQKVNGRNRTKLPNNTATTAAAKGNTSQGMSVNVQQSASRGINSWPLQNEQTVQATTAAISATRAKAAAAPAPITIAHTVPSTTILINRPQGNGSNGNITSKVQSPKQQSQQTTALVSGAEQYAAGSSASRTKPRNKSEEAINDLLQRIPDIAQIFDVQSRIGNGTFSTVLLATLKREAQLPDSMKRKFAIKHHIPTSHPDRIMKELQCMADMGGTDNVVGIHCCLRCEASAAFVMPYMPHDRFHDFYTKMEVPEIQLYMRNLLLALRHVHKFNIIHRDVKPSNFLYNRRQGQFLLVDFGLAQHVNFSAGGALQQQQLLLANSKRPRERDANAAAKQQLQQQQQLKVASVTSSEAALGGAVKRMRLIEEPTTTAAAATYNWNKMPLKPVNEIAQIGKAGGEQTPTDAAKQQSYTECAQQHPAPQLQQQLEVNVTSSSRYNTNRASGGGVGGSGNSNAKCFCFANPSVCMNCLMKKEVHASRAGTPGYRPPEVLLKYADQTTAVDVWAAGVIFLSILSSVYPFFKAPNDFVALAEIVTIFGDRAIRQTALALERMVTLSQRSKPLNLRKLCLRFRHRLIFSDHQMVRKHESPDGRIDVCKNCDQYFFNCLCEDSSHITEPLDPYECFPASAYDLLERLLEINPHNRITAEEALSHPFFTSQQNISADAPQPAQAPKLRTPDNQKQATRRRPSKAGLGGPAVAAAKGGGAGGIGEVPAVAIASVCDASATAAEPQTASEQLQPSLNKL